MSRNVIKGNIKQTKAGNSPTEETALLLRNAHKLSSGGENYAASVLGADI